MHEDGREEGILERTPPDDLRKVIDNEYREACALLEVRYNEVSEHALSRIADAQGRLSFCMDTAAALVDVSSDALGLALKSFWLYGPDHEESARRIEAWTENHEEARKHKEEFTS